MSKDKKLFKQVKGFSASEVRKENAGIETADTNGFAKTAAISHSPCIKGLETTIVSLKTLGYTESSPEIKVLLNKIVDLKKAP